MTKHLIFSGDIDNSLVQQVYQGGWSKLILCSEGGDIYCCRAICDYLARNERKVHVVGKCFSAATAIAVSGSSCTASPGCRFMLHKPHSTGVEGGSHVLKNEKDELDVWTSWYLDLLEARTKTSRADWEDLLAAETYLSASAALDAGLIDKIV